MRPLGYVVLYPWGSAVTEPQQKQASAKFLFPLPQSQLDELRRVSRQTNTPVAKIIRTDVETGRLIRAIAVSPDLAMRWVSLMEAVASDSSQSPEWREMARVWSRIVARVAGGQDAVAAMREIGAEAPGFYAEDEPQANGYAPSYTEAGAETCQGDGKS